MKTTELLERMELRSLGQRDLRVGASKMFAHEIRKFAGTLEWAFSGHGKDKLASYAHVVIETEPKILRKLDGAVKVLRGLAADIERVEPSETAIDIDAKDIVRYRRESEEMDESAPYPKWADKVQSILKKKFSITLDTARKSGKIDNMKLHSIYMGGDDPNSAAFMIARIVSESADD